jgi:hypothetical protein
MTIVIRKELMQKRRKFFSEVQIGKVGKKNFISNNNNRTDAVNTSSSFWLFILVVFNLGQLCPPNQWFSIRGNFVHLPGTFIYN